MPKLKYRGFENGKKVMLFALVCNQNTTIIAHARLTEPLERINTEFGRFEDCAGSVEN